jgi:hypothetical protein
MVRAERSERDNKKGQLVYTEINNQWNSMLKEFRLRALQPGNNTNLILIGQAGAEYKKNNAGVQEATGRLVPAGQKETGFFCDVRLQTEYDIRKQKYTATVMKPWWNGEMRGHEFENDELIFPYIMGLITMTDSEEWG